MSDVDIERLHEELVEAFEASGMGDLDALGVWADKHAESLLDEIQRLRAENERLRAAADQHIRKGHHSECTFGNTMFATCDCGYDEAMQARCLPEDVERHHD